MRFPHPAVIIRPAGSDQYGNPATGWATAITTPVQAFVLSSGALLPPTADVQVGDRLEALGVRFRVTAVKRVRSPAKDVVVSVALEVIDNL